MASSNTAEILIIWAKSCFISHLRCSLTIPSSMPSISSHGAPCSCPRWQVKISPSLKRKAGSSINSDLGSCFSRSMEMQFLASSSMQHWEVPSDMRFTRQVG